MQLEVIRHPFEGEIRTDFSGFCQLIGLFDKLSNTYDQTVFLDFTELEWFDANLSAVFCAIRHKLETENRLTFQVDHSQITGRFDVLHQNGCFQLNEQPTQAAQQSTILCTYFYPSQSSDYKQYVASDLFEHRGLASLRQINKNITTRIRTDLLEMFNNYCAHARTEAPCFVCGQYYPQGRRVVFTMVDLGVGFLPPIREFSKEPVTTTIEAIKWALKGNSTLAREDEPSGAGLSGILDFCKDHGGHLQIVTGDTLWSTNLLGTDYDGHRKLPTDFFGTSISITFNGLDNP